ncbi:hypothetical protein [Streptomyces sp. NPDC088196]|uniref:hypothetical protein n=1 Tax=Streptomyces sp. NPDC088196 TaxID=3154868 RepID=UPI00344B861E
MRGATGTSRDRRTVVVSARTRVMQRRHRWRAVSRANCTVLERITRAGTPPYQASSRVPGVLAFQKTGRFTETCEVVLDWEDGWY